MAFGFNDNEVTVAIETQATGGDSWQGDGFCLIFSVQQVLVKRLRQSQCKAWSTVPLSSGPGRASCQPFPGVDRRALLIPPHLVVGSTWLSLIG